MMKHRSQFHLLSFNFSVPHILSQSMKYMENAAESSVVSYFSVRLMQHQLAARNSGAAAAAKRRLYTGASFDQSIVTVRVVHSVEFYDFSVEKKSCQKNCMVSPFVITCLSNYDKKFFLEDIVSIIIVTFWSFVLTCSLSKQSKHLRKRKRKTGLEKK